MSNINIGLVGYLVYLFVGMQCFSMVSIAKQESADSVWYYIRWFIFINISQVYLVYRALLDLTSPKTPEIPARESMRVIGINIEKKLIDSGGAPMSVVVTVLVDAWGDMDLWDEHDFPIGITQCKYGDELEYTLMDGWSFIEK